MMVFDESEGPEKKKPSQKGKGSRVVEKRKSVEKDWRKNAARWKYSGDPDTESNVAARRRNNPHRVSRSRAEGEVEGLVIQSGGPYFLVQSGDDIVKAKPRRTTTTENPNSSLVAIGDRVLFVPSDEGEQVITHVYERVSWLSRRSIGEDDFAQIIVANVDQAIVVTAATPSQLRPGLIDRYLVAAAMGGLDPLICLNKMDLIEDEFREDIDEIAQMYRQVGYGVLLTSCKRGDGLDALAEAASGKLSVLSGHSGVGKTSLINKLIPNIDGKTQELSEQNQRGVHTTTFGALYELPGGGYIADTPGIREFGLYHFDPIELHSYYPEFVEVSGRCKFTYCTHVHEPGCAVIEAVECGDIHPLRYRNYLQILESENEYAG